MSHLQNLTLPTQNRTPLLLQATKPTLRRPRRLQSTWSTNAPKMVTGASDSSYIHTLDNSKMVKESQVGTGCNARPRRNTAVFGHASRLRGMHRRFCTTFTSHWPIDVVQKLSESNAAPHADTRTALGRTEFRSTCTQTMIACSSATMSIGQVLEEK